MECHKFAIRISFTSKHNHTSWTLVTVYGPCRGVERDNFVEWLHDLDIPAHDNWLLVGEFNLLDQLITGISLVLTLMTFLFLMRLLVI